MSGGAPDRPDFDVAIVGGGPVGAVLGALLKRGQGGARRRVLLIERQLPAGAPAPASATAPSPASTAAPDDLRVVALSRASERVLGAAGAWAALRAVPGALGRYERMHVWPADGEPRGAGSLRFDAAEIGEPDLGHIVGNARVQRAALDAFIESGGVAEAATLSALEFDARSVSLLADGRRWRASLVVGADGGRSLVRRAAGLELETQDYQQAGVVANLHSERPHEHTAWQRFLGEGTLALLPLADGTSSLVWSAPRARAEALLAASPEDFEAEVTAASGGVLGALKLASGRAAFPLRRVRAPHYARERCVLVGDAAHIVHPLAGQGLNLGLMDAAALAEVLEDASAEGEDPGALRVLRRYERWRKGENETMGRAFDLLNRFLAFGTDPVGQLATRGMGLVGRSAPLRGFFAGRALGLGGELPRAARRAGS
ncbi:MAG: FAD-dependent monooxygenase [Gammaproteobacteria bacterium]